MTLDRLREKHHVVASAFLAFYFFPLLWLSRYNYPSGDDFQTFLKAREMGAVGATRWAYFNWTGRYCSFLLQHTLAAHGDWLLAYKVVPIALLAAGFVCSYVFVRSLFDGALGGRESFTLAVALYTLLVSVTPDVTTAFYWLPTGVQYAGAVFLSMLVFALTVRRARARTLGARAPLALGVAVSIVVLAGMNEVSILFAICALLSAVCFQLVRRGRVYRAGLAFLLLAVAFGAASLFAPGNLLRMGQHAPKFPTPEVLAGAFGLTFYFFAELCATTALLPASALYLLFLWANRERLAAPLSLFSGLGWRWVLLTLFGCVAVPSVALFAALGVGLNSLPYRLWNAYAYSIVAGWFFFLTILSHNRATRASQFAAPRWLVGLLSAFVLLFLLTGFELKLASRALPSSNRAREILCLVTTRGVPTTAYQDIISGRAARYARLNAERERLIHEARGDEVELPLHSYVPDTIFLQDLNHPWGAPEMMSRVFGGGVKRFRYVETGPPASRKEGH